MTAKALKNRIRSVAKRFFPAVLYHFEYYMAANRLGDAASVLEAGFRAFVAGGEGLDCLQIGVRGDKFAPHWVSVDLHDAGPLIDHNYDVQDLEFEDETFDRVVCNAVLEHVERPQQALAELHRVLRPGGEIWVEVPFNQPYHEAPSDFWRVSPQGLRVWMKAFDEVATGLFRIDRCSIYTGTYFHGRKPVNS
jgi:SAM-dependent methyltransferase